MKKKLLTILSLILTLIFIISGFSFPVSAKGKVNVKSGTLYIDKGEEIRTGVNYDPAYKDSITVTSSDSSVAVGSWDKDTGILTIKGLKDGKATISFDGYYKVNDTFVIADFEVNVTSVFDSATFSYNYDKVTVNYNSQNLPSGCIPVFSLDGNTWSESNTLTRDINNVSYTVYKAYKVNGVVSGSIKALNMDKGRKDSAEASIEEVEMYVGDTNKVYPTDDSLTYSYHLINGRNNITFNKNDLSYTATDTGNTKLTVSFTDKPRFLADGSVSVRTLDMTVEIKVVKKEEGTEQGGSTDNGSGSNNNSSSSQNNNSNSSQDAGSNSSSSSSSSQSGSGSSSGSTTITPAKGTWKSDSTGWWFEEEDGSYPVWDWKYIDDNWYFFDRNGYMDSNGYRFGCWLRGDGSWDYVYSNGTWKSDSNGWWYEDNGWYPTSQWLKIDGYWYYFKADGYIAANEYIDGYWLGSDGAWK